MYETKNKLVGLLLAMALVLETKWITFRLYKNKIDASGRQLNEFQYKTLLLARRFFINENIYTGV